jgi:hypothetical protein
LIGAGEVDGGAMWKRMESAIARLQAKAEDAVH